MINRKSKYRKKLLHNQKENKNPFDDLSFWLTIATIDFTFGLFENDKNTEPKSNKQTVMEIEKSQKKLSTSI